MSVLILLFKEHLIGVIIPKNYIHPRLNLIINNLFEDNINR